MKITSLAMAAALSAVFAISSIAPPAEALPVPAQQVEKQANSDIVQVRQKWRWRSGRHWRGGHRYWRAAAIPIAVTGAGACGSAVRAS